MQKVHQETERQKINRKQTIIIQEVEKKKKNVTPEVRYECKSCDFKSEDDNVLTIHVKIKHGACNICQVKFSTTSEVESHMNSIHGIKPETDIKEEQLINEQNWEDLEDNEESEEEDNSKMYAIKYYLNSNGEQMGLTIKGKAKAHIESHNKIIEIMDKLPKTKEKESTFGKSKIKVIEKPPNTPTLLTLKLQVTAPDKSVGTAELKLHKPAKKGATLEIRKTSDGDFDTVEKLKDAIVKLFHMLASGETVSRILMAARGRGTLSNQPLLNIKILSCNQCNFKKNQTSSESTHSKIAWRCDQSHQV